MSHLFIKKTALTDLYLIERNTYSDNRGYFDRLFCCDELQNILGSRKIVQINHTKTTKAGIIRGMHYQSPPHAEMKFVTCLRGSIFDVAVDIRSNSPTFLQWHSEVLTQDNQATFVIPEGFAHGFQALTDDVELLYFHSSTYCLEAEAGLDAFDKILSIKWPVEVVERSIRDQSHPAIEVNFTGLIL